MIGIEETKFRVACDTEHCRKQAKWIVGNLAFKHTCINMCNDCKEELAKQLIEQDSVLQEKLLLEKAEPIGKTEQLLSVTPIEKEIFECVKVDGRVSKADLTEIAAKHGIEIDGNSKVADIIKALEESEK